MKGKKVLLYLIMCIGLVSCSKNEQEGYGEIRFAKFFSQSRTDGYRGWFLYHSGRVYIFC